MASDERLIGRQLGVGCPFWTIILELNENFNKMGFFIIGVFPWLISCLVSISWKTRLANMPSRAR
jgi:high-affinity nickel permease